MVPPHGVAETPKSERNQAQVSTDQGFTGSKEINALQRGCPPPSKTLDALTCLHWSRLSDAERAALKGGA